MTRVLLLGSSGFIGGRLLAALDADPRVGEGVSLREPSGIDAATHSTPA